MDQESVRLAQEIKGLNTSDSEDRFWKQLEDDGCSESELEYIERIVYVLAEGDIIKGKMIYENVTMTGALSWILNGLKYRTGGN